MKKILASYINLKIKLNIVINKSVFMQGFLKGGQTYVTL